MSASFFIDFFKSKKKKKMVPIYDYTQDSGASMKQLDGLKALCSKPAGPRLAPHSVPLPLPCLSEPEPPNQLLL